MSRRRRQANPDESPRVRFRIICDRCKPSVRVASYQVPARTGDRLRRMEPDEFNGQPLYSGPRLAAVPMTSDGEEVPVSNLGEAQVRKVRWRCPVCHLDVTLTAERADWLVHEHLTRGEREHFLSNGTCC